MDSARVTAASTAAAGASAASDTVNGSADFARYLLDHKGDALAGKLQLGAFAGYSSAEQFSVTRWSFPDVDRTPFPEEVRFAFAKGTCNGCHNAEQSSFPAPQFPEGQNLGFYHVTPFATPSADAGDLAGTERVSAFLKNVDLPRRAKFMQNILADADAIGLATPFAH